MKTAQELCITQQELDALVKTRDYLRGAGKDSRVKDTDVYALNYPPEKGKEEENKHVFNMNFTARQYHCGSVACIGGHVSLIIQGQEPSPVMRLTTREADKADDYVERCRSHKTLRDLYFPYEISDGCWGMITAPVAAQAIDNFLETGSPDWPALARANNLLLADDEEE